MNPLDEITLRYITGWDAAITARTMALLIGLVLVWLASRLIWRRKEGAVAAVIWLLVGVLSLVFAFFPQQLVTLVVRTEYVVRIRIIAGAISLIVLFITLESIRRTHLQERYALLWVVTALTLLIAALFPHAVDLLRAVMGMNYVGAVVAVAFTFLVLVAFHFSISMSSMQTKQSRIAQRLAILESRLREMEQAHGELDSDFAQGRLKPKRDTKDRPGQ